MGRLNQKGVIQVAVVLVLLAGIVTSVYLVNRPEMLKFLPKAFNPFAKRPIPSFSPTPVPKPVSGPICIQVITPAKKIATDGAEECREFPTPCDVPEGWKKVDSCGPTPKPRPSPSPSPKPLSCTACNADLNKDGIVNNSDIAKMTNCVVGKSKDSACLKMDFNGNGKVDQEDLKCVRSVYNQKCVQKQR